MAVWPVASHIRTREPGSSSQRLVFRIRETNLIAWCMFGIVFAFRHLNHLDANAGASYSWLTSIFSPAIGFFAGWSVITGSALFMVSGTLPAAAATLKLLEPGMVDSQSAVTLIAAGWVAVIGAIVAKGIKLSSYTQIVFTVFEVGVVALLLPEIPQIVVWNAFLGWQIRKDCADDRQGEELAGEVGQQCQPAGRGKE